MVSSVSSSQSSTSSDEGDTLLVEKRDLLFSNSTRYLVMDIIGEGGFGQVAKCLNLITGKMTAVKIHKDGDRESLQWEMKMLQAIKTLDTEKKNIVKFIEDFEFNDLPCLAFEMLDKSLWDLARERKCKPLTLNEIRPVTQQLMVAFEALKGRGIMHLDLKLDNVMLVNHKDQPFRIKLIDFGLALPVGRLKVGTEIQVLGFRAPEVMLGLHLCEAVDIWGVGLIMASMYFGNYLFPFDCEYQWMRTLLHLLGQPEEHQLNDAIYTSKYFTRDSTTQRWRLKTPEEYEDTTGVKVQDFNGKLDHTRNLDDAVENWSEIQNDIEYEDRRAFLSLLKCCLHVDSARRISAGEALKHRFITMVHLIDKMGTSSYVDAAVELMAVTHLHQSLHTERSSEDDEGYSGSDAMGCIYNCSNAGSKMDLQKEQSSASSPEEDCSAGEAVADSSSGAYGDIDVSNSEYSDGHYNTDICSHEHFYDGVRDSDTSGKEESGTAAAFGDDSTNSAWFPVAGNNNNRASADIGPTDGAAASMSSKDTAAAAIRSTNETEQRCTDRDKTSPGGAQRRTIFQRTCKFFRQLKKRAVSIFRIHKN